MSEAELNDCLDDSFKIPISKTFISKNNKIDINFNDDDEFDNFEIKEREIGSDDIYIGPSEDDLLDEDLLKEN